MFNNCNSLTSLNFSNLKTSSVESIKYMFYNCTSLTSLSLPDLDTRKIDDNENMESVFEGCTHLVLSIKRDQCSNLLNLIPEYVQINDL